MKKLILALAAMLIAGPAAQAASWCPRVDLANRYTRAIIGNVLTVDDSGIAILGERCEAGAGEDEGLFHCPRLALKLYGSEGAAEIEAADNDGFWIEDESPDWLELGVYGIRAEHIMFVPCPTDPAIM